MGLRLIHILTKVFRSEKQNSYSCVKDFGDPMVSKIKKTSLLKIIF